MPKNIVLLSDGTGNSSAKLMKTNVWRMYEAIELANGDQVALYDNGVGTSSFKPFAVLGGGFGWGLKRNVRRLYTFLCSQYADGSDPSLNDRIYAFGFSRGAFTIRVLVGLIDSQGLITGVKGRELERQAKWAYRAYRREFNPGTWLVRRLRGVRDWLLRAVVERRPAYTAAGHVRPRVTFVGLWDTVDAYGLPMDEMTRGWDQWVWPLSLSRHEMPAVVDKLCHAVALDDERHTFHPVLLDESRAPRVAHTSEERLTQVWFAGAHSNIGGGYPDDAVAHVPLLWMAHEAAAHGLRLHPHVVADWKARADPNGPVHDSRAGLGAYYRYNPRSIERLTTDRFAEVRIPAPKIHESVFARIVSGRDDYAPIVLPADYAVVHAGGRISGPHDRGLEEPAGSRARRARQERVWNLVWWRRLVYFATVLVTALLAAAPLLVGAGGVLPWKPRSVAGIIALLGNFLPDGAALWVGYYQQDPVFLLAGAGLLAGLLVAGAGLQQAIRDHMRVIWDDIVARPGTGVAEVEWPDDWVYRLRSHRIYRRFFEVATQHVFPFVFGVGCLASLVLLAVGTGNRATFASVSAAGWTCPGVARPAAVGTSAVRVALPSWELCQATGLELRAGETYSVSIRIPADWNDGGTIPVTSPAGFGSGERPWVLVPGLAFRRVLSAPWFAPMVRIGEHGAEYHVLTDGHTTFTPAQTGQLFLFVNDAIGIGPWLRDFYCNNEGIAAVTIVRGAAEVLPPQAPFPDPRPAGRRSDGGKVGCPAS